MRLRPRIVAAALAAALLTLGTACGGTGTAADSGTDTVTVYSADGLSGWYQSRFDAFTAQTGIAVNLVEAGSGEVVSRLEKEQSNPQADVVVTLPPFIQKADSRDSSFRAVSTPPRFPRRRRTRPVTTFPSSRTTCPSSPTRRPHLLPGPGTTCCPTSSRARYNTPAPARPVTAPRCYCSSSI